VGFVGIQNRIEASRTLVACSAAQGFAYITFDDPIIGLDVQKRLTPSATASQNLSVQSANCFIILLATNLSKV